MGMVNLSEVQDVTYSLLFLCEFSPTFLCFEIPLPYLRPSIIYSVPFERIVQRAY